MVQKNGTGPGERLENRAFQAAAHISGLGVAIEDGGYLELLNYPARYLLLVPGPAGEGDGGSSVERRIALDSLPQRFQDPDAFRAWREGVLANLPDPGEAGAFWTKSGRFLQIELSTAGVCQDGVFVWGITDMTAGKRAADGLFRASESAEAAKKAKTRLLAMMSHEVRTPMNAILGMTELLLHTPLSREQWNLLDTARTAGESLIGILDSVLDISKVESGTLPLERRPFSPADLVEGLTEEIAPRAAASGLDISCFVDAGMPRILEGDPDRIRQVLMNLLGNAVKFTRQGSVSVAAESLNEGADAHWVQFTVEDTGPGIRADSLERIFDPFFQVGAPENGDSRGVGLGLSIVRSFVDLMGGRVEVDGSPGKGSRFRVFLPLPVSKSVFPKRRASDLTYPEFHGILLSPSERIRKAAGQVFSALRVSHSLSKDPSSLSSLLGDVSPDRKAMVFVDHRFGEPELDWVRHSLSLKSRETDLGLAILVPPGYENGQGAEASIRTLYLAKPLTRRGVAGAFQEAQGNSLPQGTDQDGSLSEIPDLKGIRALLVEDRDENRHYLSRVLQGAGVQVDTASDGEIGFIQFQAGRYDLVLTDLDMPGLDGFGLLQKIRAAETEKGLGRVPVVAITAHTDSSTSERCFKSGMDAFVIKPVARRELLEVVRDFARRDPMVLVVEDDARNLDFTLQILSQNRYRVDGVSNGEEAVTRVSRGGVSAVLLDMTLPDIPGLEVVKRIRALPNGSHIPVIGVTGHAGADQAALCREAGCTEFVEKPVRWESFLPTLKALARDGGGSDFTTLLDGLTRVENHRAAGTEEGTSKEGGVPPPDAEVAAD